MREATDSAVFDGAIEVAGRLRQNVETVVLGKSETVTLVVAALASRGHVLLEDVPGTAKTVLARCARREHRRRGGVEGPVHARPPADRHHRPLDLGPEDARVRVSRRSGVRERPPRRRGEPRAPQGAVGAARGDGRAAGDGRRRYASSPRSVLPDRDREPDRAGGHVPAPRGATRPVPPAHLARLSERRRRAARSSTISCTATRSSRLRSVDRPRRARAAVLRRRGGVRRPAAQALDRRPRARHARARDRRRSAPPSAGRSRSSASPAPGRCCTAGRSSSPEDVEDLFLPVLGHRLVARSRSLFEEEPDAAAGDRARLASACLEQRSAARARLGCSTRARPRRERDRPRGPFPLVPRRRFLGVQFGAPRTSRAGRRRRDRGDAARTGPATSPRTSTGRHPRASPSRGAPTSSSSASSSPSRLPASRSSSIAGRRWRSIRRRRPGWTNGVQPKPPSG